MIPAAASPITIIAGHYGSGKTEFAVNLALAEAGRGQSVSLVDLDIVNPYFCCRERGRELAGAGVELIAPSQQCSMADVPALPPEVAKIFAPGSARAIIDVGGDGAGAKALSRYMPQIRARGYDMWLVFNANRPQTADAGGAMGYIKMIEAASRLEVTGIVNNTHLCALTTPEEVLRGSAEARRLAQMAGLPLICSAAPRAIAGEPGMRGLAEPLFAVDIHMKKPWEL